MDRLLSRISKQDGRTPVQVQSLIALLTIVEELKTTSEKEDYDLCTLVKLLVDLALRCPQMVDLKNKNGEVAFKYILQIVSKFVAANSSQSTLIENC